MSNHPKIQTKHLERLAYIYIRQSSPRQVEEHLESKALQYQLEQRALALGWSAEQVVIIDDDLGKSASSSSERAGFQSLVASVGLAQVGIILVTTESRLARNCADWYQLLDLASVTGTLIGDGGTVYDPRDYNDRLLLGLKGTFSEVQWYQMYTQLYQARLNKAQRGELVLRLPVGLEWLEEGQVVFTPDQEVQATIRLVFDQFDRLGTARAVLRYCRAEQIQLPRRIQTGPEQGQLDWVKPSYQAIYRILKHPAYGGAYTYGKRHSEQLPGHQQKVVSQPLPLAEWPVLIQDAFPGYISWEHYLQNQARLQENVQRAPWRKGAPRSGSALLQGIALCGHCGRPLRIRYSNHFAYVCQAAQHQYGEPLCQSCLIAPIDEAVSQVFLAAVQPAQLETALAALEQVETERQAQVTLWQHRLERARYEADLARRRYERVDPDHRLVAVELERQWEQKLQSWQQLQQEWAQQQSQVVTPLTEADKALIRSLATDVPALWHAETTTPQERKRLLRCLIQDVTLDAVSKPGRYLIHIRWHTDATTTVEADRPKGGCRTAPMVVEQIRALAQHHPDEQIAIILNEADIKTATHKAWTPRRVTSMRQQHAIPSACPPFSQGSEPRGDGLVTVKAAARQLGVAPGRIVTWFRRGLLAGHQRQRNSPVWVRLTEEDLERLNGSSPHQPEMEEWNELIRHSNLTVDQVRAEICAGRWLPYRLRLNNRWRWYVIRRDNDA
jgi:DNA invertase Pin-like site-specific DNA recombinase